MRTNTIKEALIAQLQKVPDASDGTKIAGIVESGEDAFDKYPVIRVIPANVTESITNENRQLVYTVNFVVSVYLDLGNAQVPDKQVIDTLMEFVDSIYEVTFEDDSWLPKLEGFTFPLIEGASTNVVDTVDTKTGTAVYCDIVLPVSYLKAV